jgi:pantothenate kinase
MDRYVPGVKPYPYLENAAESVFEGTLIDYPPFRAKFFKNIDIEEDVDFVKNNMGKWPVITLDFQGIEFPYPRFVTNEEITEKLVEKLVLPAYKLYDYLLFHDLTMEA